ncbi:MAG: helix-turn-helix transcriptional regulator [Erysipelotrichaceae bacterium]|nr:helix-turn-helix transcriptional regulator [Erysipelotrichaceae bacterium]
MEIVCERLKMLREGLKFSQAKIASVIGTSQVSINRYENGTGAPPIKTLLWYADYFDVSLDYIFGRTDNPQGKLYEYKPIIIENNVEMQRFVEMCFDPKSPMNDKLKQTLIRMLEEGKK